MRNHSFRRSCLLAVAGVVLSTGLVVLPGCQQFERYTYRSDVHSQKTITLLDTSSGERLLTVDIPPGEQLNMVFDNDIDTAEQRGSDTLRWALRRIGDDSVAGGSVMTVPPPSSRRIDMTLRQ